MKNVILASMIALGSFAMAEGAATAPHAKKSAKAARAECIKENKDLKKDKTKLEECIKSKGV